MNVCLYSCLIYPARKAHLCCAVLSCILRLVWLCHIFSTLSHERHDFREKIIKHKVPVLIISKSSFGKFLILIRIKWYIFVNKHISTPELPLLFSDFKLTWIFQAANLKKKIHVEFWRFLKYQILWKSFQWEPSFSMRTDKRTDGQRHRLDDSYNKFPQFCEGA